jgi:hypothetical protein
MSPNEVLNHPPHPLDLMYYYTVISCFSVFRIIRLSLAFTIHWPSVNSLEFPAFNLCNKTGSTLAIKTSPCVYPLSQEPLPAQPLSGMLNKFGAKVRLHFKLEMDQLWIGTKGEWLQLSVCLSVVCWPILSFWEDNIMLYIMYSLSWELLIFNRQWHQVNT